VSFKIITFPIINDPRGNLTFLQEPSQIPFKIKRVFWTYDVPGMGIRGGHAYKNQEEIIIALSGSFEVVLENSNGTSEKIFLNRSYLGLYLPPNTWRCIENFSTNALSLHLSSMKFDSNDYIRDFKLFKNQ
jgi:oxalate decarboxylase/phosphoglucose isomerase-like protein (cupin superfamily)